MEQTQSDPSQRPKGSEVSAGVEEAYKKALQIRELEKKHGYGFSTGRMVATLGHKFGFDPADARAAAERLREEEQQAVKADLHSSDYGVAPVECSASMALARLHDLTAATQLMARSTPVSREAEKGLKEITRLAQDQGYNLKTSQNRAFYTTDMVRDDHTLHLMGWHGTGRFAGGEKAILELYDSRKGDKPVVSIGVLNEENLTAENERHVVQKIIDYLRKHG